MKSPIDTYCQVFFRDTTQARCIASDHEYVDEALRLFIGSAPVPGVYSPNDEGEGCDSIVRLTTIAGEVMPMLASSIMGYRLTSRASRARERALSAELEAEGTPSPPDAPAEPAEVTPTEPREILSFPDTAGVHGQAE